MTDQGFGPPGWQPLGYESPGTDLPFKKWRTGSTVFGTIAIVIGASSGCLGLFIPLAMLAPQPRGQNPGTMVSGTLLYLVVAGSLIWLGIGAIQMRRWVRPLVLTLGTVILIIGAFSVVWMIFFLPVMTKITSGIGARGGPPAGMVMFFTTMTMLIMGILFFIVPGAFVWFYKKLEVKAALEHFDPLPRWTDRCPIPVLGIVVTLLLYASTMLAAMPQAIMPVFGTVIHGPPAMALQTVIAAAALVLAWLSFHCRPAGWWGTTAFVIVLMFAYLMTGIRSDQLDLYGSAGFTANQLDAIAKLQMSPAARLVLQLPIPLLTIGYLVYVRRYFNAHGRT